MPEPDRGALTPPATVVVVRPEDAAGAVPLTAERAAELRERAAAFVADLLTLHPGSPAFTEKVAAITSMGEADMRRAASVSRRMLERPAAAVAGPGSGGGDAQSRVAATLTDLRTLIVALDPRRADVTRARRLLRWLPGGESIDDYFVRYQSSQAHLDAIIRALSAGQDELRKDNAAIETEKASMWSTMSTIAEYTALATALDDALESAIASLDAAGRERDAQTVRTDALFPVRQRRQDFATQAAVNVQGHMALELVRRNNLELITGVDRAQTTTLAALRTAVIVSQSLAQQSLVLDRVAALTAATSGLAGSTAAQLRAQSAGAPGSTTAAAPDLATLQSAFDDVVESLDALDTFRAQAVDSMGQTVHALEGQIARATPVVGHEDRA